MDMMTEPSKYELDPLQRVATGLMMVLTLVTFVAANMQALLWQSSDWLVSTVLPAVVVDLTNDERAELAAAPLQRNSLLDQAARAKAQHMADNQYFAHFAPDGTTPWSFFADSGYVYAHAGENLAIHFTDSTEVVEAWMQSPAHRKNIVDQKYTEIGVGTARGTFDGYDTVYVVQLFGTPAVPPAPVAVVPPQPAPTMIPPAIVEPAVLAEAVIDVPTPTPTLAPVTVPAPVELVPESPVLIPEEAQVIVPDVVAVEPPAEALVLAESDPELVVEAPIVPAVVFSEPATEIVLSEAETVVITTELATSSGLAIASLIEPNQAHAHAGATIAAVATKPNVLLNAVYTGIVGVIILLLITALIGEARRLHIVQVAYSIALLMTIGGLWYAHTLLTRGAVVV